MSKITNDGLTRSGTGCFIEQWASKGLMSLSFVCVDDVVVSV